jgi:ABC-type transport system involved in multi-copper enzyme maturation permease subunit
MTIPMNPILEKEIRTRLRGARAFQLLFAYVLVQVLIVGGLIVMRGLTSSDMPLGQVGQLFWGITFWMQLGLVTLITPGLTSGLVVAEREQQTLDTILLTGLKSADIVVGKLCSIAMFIVWLLVGSLPVTAIVFMTGGVAPAEILLAYVLLMFAAMVYGSIGIACSAVAKSQGKATLLAYAAAIALFIGTCIPAVPAIGMVYGGDSQVAYFSAINPLGAPGAAKFTEVYFGISFPAWLISGVVNACIAMLFTLLASHHLSGCQQRSAVLLRRVVFGMFVLLSALLGGAAKLSIGFIQLFVFIVPILLIATFGTSVRSAVKPQRPLWKRLFSGNDVVSGRLFAVVIYSIGAVLMYVVHIVFRNAISYSDGHPFEPRALQQLLISGFMNTVALTGVAALSMRYLSGRWATLGFTIIGWATPMFILGALSAFLPSDTSTAIGFIAQTTVFDYSIEPRTSHWIVTAVAGVACGIVAKWKR